MGEKKFIKYTVAVIVVILITFIIKIISYNGVVIYIDNETNTDIQGLNIQFDNESYIIDIKINEKSKMKISQTDDFGEGDLELTYYDYDGNEHRETLVGYIEKGQSAKVRVHIKAVDGNGVMEFSVSKVQLPL